MSLLPATRQSLRSLPSLKRQVSSKTDPKNLSLPPHKLRALISIYHKSAYFITPQNLSDAIDRAFIGDPDELAGISMTSTEMTYDDLTKALRRRAIMMKTGRWRALDRPVAGWLPQEWSEGRRGREAEIFGAFYGTEESTKPGLEVLQEERARLKKDILEDTRLKKNIVEDGEK